MTNAVTLASLANSGYLRNRIINGAMSIWQRGTSGFTSGYFTDRFFLGGTISAAARSTDVPSGFLYSSSISGSNFPIIYQRIESVNTTDLVGQDVTISFWLKQTTGAGTGAFAVSLFYPTAVDNYTSATQIGGYVSINTTSSWARYTVTFNSLPNGAANGLALGIGSSSSGSSVTLITGVQLEVGTQATPFEWRPYTTELSLCQRYFWQSASYIAYAQGCLNTSTVADFSIKNPVTMRVSPTGSLKGSAGDLTVFVYGTGARTVTNANVALYPNVDSSLTQVTWASAASGTVAALDLTNGAALRFSAEL